jgi:hypothetical protein
VLVNKVVKRVSGAERDEIKRVIISTYTTRSHIKSQRGLPTKIPYAFTVRRV